jgi:hypothetical protein
MRGPRTRISSMSRMSRMKPMRPLPPPPPDEDVIAAGGRVITTPTGAKVIMMPDPAVGPTPSTPQTGGTTPATTEAGKTTNELRETSPLAALTPPCQIYCFGGYSF